MGNQPTDRVAVIIAAYHAEATIARAVRSALEQPQAAEVVVVDDASRDGTVQAALAADDGSGRLRVLIQPSNAGPSAARNRAIAATGAPWITILDADDFFLGGRIGGLLDYVGWDVDIVADDLWQVSVDDVDGARNCLFDFPLDEPRMLSFEAFVLGNITRARSRGELGFIKPLISRSFLKQHMMQYDETLRLGEDYALYARMLAAGARMLLVPAQGYVSVVRPDSLSALHSEQDLRRLRDSDVGLLTFENLTRADKRAIRQHYRSVDCRLQWRALIRAKKERNPFAVWDCFMKPPSIVFYLVRQIFGHFLRPRGRMS